MLENNQKEPAVNLDTHLLLFSNWLSIKEKHDFEFYRLSINCAHIFWMTLFIFGQILIPLIRASKSPFFRTLKELTLRLESSQSRFIKNDEKEDLAGE